MKKLFFVLFLLSNFLPTEIWAQKRQNLTADQLETLIALEDSIAQLANIVVNDTIPDNRLRANDDLLPMVRRFLSLPFSYAHPLEGVPQLSIQYPEDNAFRIVTWELREAYDVHHYFGFVQFNNKKSTFVELQNAFSPQNTEAEKSLLSPDQWQGGIVYRVKQFEAKNDKNKYLIFSYNSGDGVEKYKICDVLTLSGKQIKLGAPVFKGKIGNRTFTNYRLILPHSVWTTIRLNYDDAEKMIIHDHLEKRPSPNPEDGMVGMPDGTYHAFRYEKGVWNWIEKLANTQLDAPPMVENPARSKERIIVEKDNAQGFEWPTEIKEAAAQRNKKNKKEE